MFQSSNSLLATALALSLLFSRAHGFGSSRMVIGYAELNTEQVDDIKDHDELEDHGNPSDTVLGEGLYLVDSPDKLSPAQGSLYCVVEAKSKEVRETDKVFIPQSYQKRKFRGQTETVTLWGDDKAIEKYAEKVAKVDDGDEAFRFTLVEDPEQIKMLVPNDAVDEDDLDLKPTCFASKEALEERYPAKVDWISWGIVNPESQV